MNDIPEPAKKIQRLMMVVIIVGAIGAVAYAGVNWLSPEEEAACPEGQELVRNNPPGKSPRFVCRPSSVETGEAM